MGKPQARMSDPHLCNVPVIIVPPAPPAPMPIMPPCSPTVIVSGLPAARLGDLHASAPPHPIVLGSMTVMINMMPAARMGDLGACGGTIVMGAPTVLTGG